MQWQIGRIGNFMDEIKIELYLQGRKTYLSLRKLYILGQKILVNYSQLTLLSNLLFLKLSLIHDISNPIGYRTWKNLNNLNHYINYLVRWR